jgi:hypothetical protein
MPRRPRQFRARWRVLAGCALGGLALFALAEGLLRLDPRQLPTDAINRIELDERRVTGLRLLANDELGFVGVPHDRHRDAGVDYDYVATTDEHGFRNPSPWPERADIVVLGDSQAYGFGVDDDEHWASLIDQALPGVEVVNLGLLGAAPQQLGRLYEAFGTDLQPKLVIVALFPPNALRSGALFEEWQAAGKPEGFNVWRALGRPRADGAGALDGIKRALAQSYAVLYLRGWLKRLRDPAATVHEVALDGGKVRLMPGRYAETAERALPGNPDFERVIAELARLHRQIRADGSAMLVVLFPTKEEVHLPLLAEQAPELVSPFATALERRGIAYLDLASPLRAQVAQGRRLFLEIDLHPNVDGHRLIADLLLDHLQQNGMAYY